MLFTDCAHVFGVGAAAPHIRCVVDNLNVVYGKTLKSLAEKLGLEENVEFVGKITDKKLLAEYYAACDLLLFPSVFDNGSIVLLESAANGLPSATVAGSC